VNQRTALAAAVLLVLNAGTAATWAASAQAPSVQQMLEEEKQTDNIYKAYFPSREMARKAAISFHGQLLETDYQGGFLVLQLEPEEMDQLRGFGFRLERAAEFIERRNRRLTDLQLRQSRRSGMAEPLSIPGYSCYETVEETFTAADALLAAHPTLGSWVDAGDSWQKTQGAGGYDMRVLKLTNSATQGLDGAAKPKLFINAAIHAREYTTAPMALEFARWLMNGYGVDADATWILDENEVHLMLHTNPDGRKRAETGLSWRKNVDNNYCANTNTRGVDLNRNFSFEWNSTGGQGSSGSTCSLTYRGPAAGSEPEVQAVQNYVRNLWPDRRGPLPSDAAPADTSGIHLDLHSYSELVLWPWGATNAPAPNGTALQTLGRKFAYFNGYTPTQSIGLYPTDGTSDGPSYGELGVAAFTFEMGTSFFQSCSTYNNVIKPANLPALVYAAKVVRTPYLTPAGPDVTTLSLAGEASGSGVPAGTAVALSASVTDTRFNNSNGSEAVQAIAEAQASIDQPFWHPDAQPVPLQAADGNFNSVTEALSGSLDTSGLAPGRHLVYVRGRDAGGAWGAVSAVFLNVNAAPPVTVADIEPNGTLATAGVAPSLPAVVYGAMSSAVRSERSDVDVFRVSVPAGATLQATLTPNASLNANLEILDASGVRLAISTQGTGLVDSASANNAGAAAVTMYLRITYAGGTQGGVGGVYQLDMALAP
jgi:carboxypeptidase T